MPIYENQNGTKVPVDAYVNQGGTPARCNVYENQNGTPVLLSAAIIDDFERGNVTPYTNRSDTGAHSVNTAAARSGTYGYEAQGEDAIWSVPGSGLPHYPEDGETFEYYANIRSHEQIWLFFGGTADADRDRYQVELINDGDFRVRIDQGGTRSTLDNLGGGTVSYPTGSWLRVEVAWRAGGGFDITLDVGATTYGPLTSTNSTYTGPGKVGYRTSANAHVYVDDVALLP